MKEIAKSLSSQELYKFVHAKLEPALPFYEPVDKRDEQLHPPFDHSVL